LQAAARTPTVIEKALWDTAAGRVVRALNNHRPACRRRRVQPSQAATGHRRRRRDGPTLDASKATTTRSCSPVPSGRPRRSASAPDGELIAGVGTDIDLCAWNTDGSEARQLTFSTDERQLVTRGVAFAVPDSTAGR
jgi:hypothetical protein